METRKKQGPLSLLSPGILHDRPIHITMWALILFGTAMIISTAMGQGTQAVPAIQVVLQTAIKQTVFIGFAYFLLVFMDRLFRMRWFSALRYVFCGLFLLLMCLPFLFPAVGGSHAWINLGPMTVQPSEFGKPFLILLCASSLYRKKKQDKKKKEESLFQLFRLPVWMTVLTMVLLVFQKDYGTLVITASIVFICFLVPSGKGLARGQRLLVLLFVAALAVGTLFLFTDVGISLLKSTDQTYHIAERIENMRNPYIDVYSTGYQPANSLYGIADAGLFGRGYGNSARKYGYLTQADNDYILAVTIEETGIFGLAFIIVCYGILTLRLVQYATRTRNTEYKIILTGTAAYLFLHFIINVGGVGALIPMTGVPLLFISSGGSSLMAICIALGACQHCIEHIRRKEERKPIRHESSLLREL